MKNTPAKQNAREHGRIILAHGEVTNHCHEVLTVEGAPPGMAVAQFFDDPETGTRTLMLLEPCVLKHDEHDPIALDPKAPQSFRQGDVYGEPIADGTWRIRRQQEFEPEGWRAVAD